MPTVNSTTALPSVAMRPIALLFDSVNQICPSGPAAREPSPAVPVSPALNWVTAPAGIAADAVPATRRTDERGRQREHGSREMRH